MDESWCWLGWIRAIELGAYAAECWLRPSPDIPVKNGMGVGMTVMLIGVTQPLAS